MRGALEQDALIAGRYRLDRPLGKGGMGTVWSAKQIVTHERVALKFVKGLGAAPPAARRRFMREARATNIIRHPSVVKVHDCFELDDGAPVLVMEELHGESLAVYLKRVGALRLSTCADLLAPVIAAVGTAHAVGIVHRDLKPDNIFLATCPGGAIEVRVLDFGIAKLTADEGSGAPSTDGLTEAGQMLGTPHYMSPEQVFGERDVDHRADVWALGVLLYQCVAGKLPFDGAGVGQIIKQILTAEHVPIRRIVPRLPGDVARLIGRMLAKDRQSRPADVREVLRVLQRHGGTSSAHWEILGSPPDLNRPTKRIRHYPRVVGLLAIAAGLFGTASCPLSSQSPPLRSASASQTDSNRPTAALYQSLGAEVMSNDNLTLLGSPGQPSYGLRPPESPPAVASLPSSVAALPPTEPRSSGRIRGSRSRKHARKPTTARLVDEGQDLSEISKDLWNVESDSRDVRR